MSISIHDKSTDGTYLSTYIHVKNVLNWSEYFNKMRYTGDTISTDMIYEENVNCYKYKFLSQDIHVATGNAVSQYNGKVLMYINHMLNKVNATELSDVIKDYNREGPESFSHLIIFDAVADLTFPSDGGVRELAHRYVYIRKPTYSSNTLKKGYKYLAFIDTSTLGYDLEYYSMHPVIR